MTSLSKWRVAKASSSRRRGGSPSSRTRRRGCSRRCARDADAGAGADRGSGPRARRRRGAGTSADLERELARTRDELDALRQALTQEHCGADGRRVGRGALTRARRAGASGGAPRANQGAANAPRGLSSSSAVGLLTRNIHVLPCRGELQDDATRTRLYVGKARLLRSPERRARSERGRHPQGLQARSPEAPSRPQPGRRRRGGEVQGVQRGLPGPLRRRETSDLRSVRPRRPRGRRRFEGAGDVFAHMQDLFAEMFSGGGFGASAAEVAASGARPAAATSACRPG